MAYDSTRFTGFEVPTVNEWNQIHDNTDALQDGTAIDDGAITAAKILFAVDNVRITGAYPDFYVRPNISMTAGNSASDTVTLPREIAAGELVIVMKTSETWNHVEIVQPTSGTTVTVTRNCTVTSANVRYRLSAIYYRIT